MWDVHIAELAGRQHNRVARTQLLASGMSPDAIEHRVGAGRLVAVHEGVFAVAPVLDDAWGGWMGATLTAPGSVLSHFSAAAARGLWSRTATVETVTRPGSGGPRLRSGVWVHRSSTLAGEVEEVRGVPMTTAERTLLDIAPRTTRAALARALREAVRLQQTSLEAVADALGRHAGRRGSRRLGLAVAAYAGLPLERARSGAEVRAMVVLRDAGVPLPRLNAVIAGEEADLSWPRQRLIVEVDGGPFHLDRGEDARKQAVWAAAGWTVRRLPSDDVHERPDRLLALAPAPNVPGTRS